ncbi:unnamed protein product [Psylliodes chrysocephalus]|uniref:Dynein light chain n=1 Tax=Psylliodes chrysocephalus TaxID=3402493 RepID=A0A9P0G2G6_9CUCU|nr:unnamed protein product [Psylliodes chrysocephala]
MSSVLKASFSEDIKLSIRWSSPQNYKEPKMTDRKAVIKNADMSEDMQQDAVDCATQAIEKYNIEKKEDTSRLVPYTIGQDLMIYE